MALNKCLHQICRGINLVGDGKKVPKKGILPIGHVVVGGQALLLDRLNSKCYLKRVL